ncbi:MAG: hypothetical protein ACOC2U_04095 [bacterium]
MKKEMKTRLRKDLKKEIWDMKELDLDIDFSKAIKLAEKIIDAYFAKGKTISWGGIASEYSEALGSDGNADATDNDLNWLYNWFVEVNYYKD